jgi:hypothetical protein
MFDMDPRKLVRMLVLGMDDEVKKTPWAWVCTMCARCLKQCPMSIDIPKLVYNMRSSWPRDKRPKGIRASCDQHIRTGNAMGAPKDDFIWTVEDVAEEIRENQPLFKDLQVTVDRKGAKMVLNQNSREPVTEPDELSPLWKVLHLVGADWTYPSVMWGAKTTASFWRMKRAGATSSRSSSTISTTTWALKWWSIRSEGTPSLQSWKD